MRNPLLSVRLLLLTLALAVLLAGCGGKTMVESDLRIKGAPDWVNKGTQVLRDRNGRLFHGVGSAPPLGDLSLQTSTADDRARAEVARILSSYLQVASSDYLAAAGNDGGGLTAQSVSRQIDSLTQVNLSGARIVARWRDKRSGNVYSLAELDMQQVKGTLDRVAEMNEGFRGYLGAQGDNVFDRMTERKQ